MTLCARSQVALYASVFFSCVSFSVVLPTLWPYLSSLHASTTYLALVVAIYSAGEAIGGLLFGALFSSWPSATSLSLATVVGLLGSVLYVGAQAFPSGTGTHLVLIARLLHGIWTGAVQALQQLYLVDVVATRNLSAFTVTMSGFANLGFVFGPAFALFSSLIPPFGTAPGLAFDQLTAPGYFVLLAGLVNIALYLVVLDERTDRFAAAAAREAEIVRVGDEYAGQVSSDEETPLLGGEPKPEQQEDGSYIPAAIICNIVCFTHFLGFAIQETVTTPLVQKWFNWSVTSANELFTTGGVTSLLGVVSIGFLTRVASDRVVTVLTLVLGVLGYALLMVSQSEQRFVAGFLLCMLAFPTGRAGVLSLYTKVLPRQRQGVGQGVFLAAGALARVVGPFWAVRAVHGSAAWVFGGTAAVFVGCLAMMGVWFRQLDTREASRAGLK